MNRHRRLLLTTGAAASITLAVLACSSETDRSFGTGEPPEASLPPPGNTPDAEAPDATPAPDKQVVCAVSPCVTQITAGTDHYCARISDGTVRCWGNNSHGQLGYAEDDNDGGLEGGGTDGGSEDAGLAPRPVSGLSQVTQVTASRQVSCARLESGEIACWGSDETGVLGSGRAFEDPSPHPVPTTVPLPGPAARVDLLIGGGWPLACATLATGQPWCWGYNGSPFKGFLAQSAFADGGPVVSTPALADLLVPFGPVRFGRLAPFAITPDGQLVVWGFVSGRDARAGQLLLTHPFVLSPKNVTEVGSSSSHACAITDGQVACWRHSGPAYLCDGSGLREDVKLPVRVQTRGSAQPRQLVARYGRYGTCARMSDGTVQCCGSNANGALGTGSLEAAASMIFTEASALEGHVVELAATEESTCALLESGEVRCWGGNRKGELGQGTMDTDPHPMPLTMRWR